MKYEGNDDRYAAAADDKSNDDADSDGDDDDGEDDGYDHDDIFFTSVIMIVSIVLSTETFDVFFLTDKLFQVNIHQLLFVKRLP